MRIPNEKSDSFKSPSGSEVPPVLPGARSQGSGRVSTTPEFHLALDVPWPYPDEAEFAGGMNWPPELDSGPHHGGGSTTRLGVRDCTPWARARRKPVACVPSRPGGPRPSSPVLARDCKLRQEEQLPEKPPRAEITAEVTELELAELQLRRVGELLVLGSCIQVVGVDKFPDMAGLGFPVPGSPEKRRAQWTSAQLLRFCSVDLVGTRRCGGHRRVQPAERPVRELDELCKLSSGCKRRRHRKTPSLSIIDLMLSTLKPRTS